MSQQRLFWGLLLILAGLASAFANMGLIAQRWLDYWPALLLVIGIWLLYRGLRQPDGRGITPGLITSASGAFFLAEALGYVDISFYLAVLLTSIGAGLVIRALFYPAPTAPGRNE